MGRVQVTRATARQFIADWFGFNYKRVHVTALKRDEDGACIGVCFIIHSLARQRYYARRRTADAEWELILLP